MEVMVVEVCLVANEEDKEKEVVAEKKSKRDGRGECHVTCICLV